MQGDAHSKARSCLSSCAHRARGLCGPAPMCNCGCLCNSFEQMAGPKTAEFLYGTSTLTGSKRQENQRLAAEAPPVPGKLNPGVNLQHRAF